MISCWTFTFDPSLKEYFIRNPLYFFLFPLVCFFNETIWWERVDVIVKIGRGMSNRAGTVTYNLADHRTCTKPTYLLEPNCKSASQSANRVHCLLKPYPMYAEPIELHLPAYWFKSRTIPSLHRFLSIANYRLEQVNHSRASSIYPPPPLSPSPSLLLHLISRWWRFSLPDSTGQIWRR